MTAIEKNTTDDPPNLSSIYVTIEPTTNFKPFDPDLTLSEHSSKSQVLQESMDVGKYPKRTLCPNSITTISSDSTSKAEIKPSMKKYKQSDHKSQLISTKDSPTIPSSQFLNKTLKNDNKFSSYNNCDTTDALLEEMNVIPEVTRYSHEGLLMQVNVFSEK